MNESEIYTATDRSVRNYAKQQADLDSVERRTASAGNRNEITRSSSP